MMNLYVDYNPKQKNCNNVFSKLSGSSPLQSKKYTIFFLNRLLLTAPLAQPQKKKITKNIWQFTSPHFTISESSFLFVQISVVNLHSVHAFKILRCSRSRRFSTQHHKKVKGVSERFRQARQKSRDNLPVLRCRKAGFFTRFLGWNSWDTVCWINMLSDSKMTCWKCWVLGRSLIGSLLVWTSIQWKLTNTRQTIL